MRVCLVILMLGLLMTASLASAGHHCPDPAQFKLSEIRPLNFRERPRPAFYLKLTNAVAFILPEDLLQLAEARANIAGSEFPFESLRSQLPIQHDIDLLGYAIAADAPSVLSEIEYMIADAFIDQRVAVLEPHSLELWYDGYAILFEHAGSGGRIFCVGPHNVRVLEVRDWVR